MVYLSNEWNAYNLKLILPLMGFHSFSAKLQLIHK